MENQKVLLLGDEAIAQGAIDAGASGFYAYPGTPSTEIMEYVQHSKEADEGNIHRQWSANEKTAVESALGMSYAGKRTVACMKHVGVNVAADPFVNSGVTGANGGLIVVAADDPSMHSSQNEQDSRFFANFSLIPCLEPSNQQEAYDMMFYGMDFSEKFKTPLLMRITTRLAHSRSGVVLKSKRPQNSLKLPEDGRQFVLLPSISRKRYKLLLEAQTKFVEESENSPFNVYTDGADKSLGVIACGIGYNYYMENFPSGSPNPVLKIGQYPAPRKLIERMAKECKTILVIEEGMPLLEENLRGFMNAPLEIKGRLDGTLPRDGELNPNLIRIGLGLSDNTGNDVPEVVKLRPPAMCTGCSHIDTYKALIETVKDVYGDGHVFSDIGCYTLGAYPPYEIINSCVDMGASVTMAKGAADAGLFPSIAVIGDSTFTHSGMTGLLDAVIENTNMILFILDNSTTAMTGGQKSHAYGKIKDICIGLGVNPEHVREVVPLPKNHSEFVNIIKEELEYNGLSVIIPTRECIQTIGKKK
ncbi:indolepyruvate ferredoxin oxidoreductase [Myxococcota bacterium]|nr:indolepyruvate ferredoxin oxidoreductase [Myxococcota bacterium]MBU1379760.1 indolepyruvate ferredoxin oxidoreductase [Myxococcota bacterium]MBU1498527.1 indolepyruvate ferredoxin oxidoreductase [Myxococcota bacterium]